MSRPGARHEFPGELVAELLSEPDRRLRGRGVSAAVFVVGGAAIAVARVRENRLTADIDVVPSDDPAVLEEAAGLASERGLPANWLNFAARMWMPPLPEGALSKPDRPGLHVTY